MISVAIAAMDAATAVTSLLCTVGVAMAPTARPRAIRLEANFILTVLG